MHKPLKILCKNLFIMTMPLLLWAASVQAKTNGAYINFLGPDKDAYRDQRFQRYAEDLCLQPQKGGYKFVAPKKPHHLPEVEKGLNVVLSWISKHSKIGNVLIDEAKKDDVYICYDGKRNFRQYLSHVLAVQLSRRDILEAYQEYQKKPQELLPLMRLTVFLAHELHHHAQNAKRLSRTARTICIEDGLDWTKVKESDASVIGAIVLYEVLISAFPGKKAQDLWKQYINDPKMEEYDNWAAHLAKAVPFGKMTVNKSVFSSLFQRWYEITAKGQDAKEYWQQRQALQFVYTRNHLGSLYMMSDTDLKDHLKDSCQHPDGSINPQDIETLSKVHLKGGYLSGSATLDLLKQQKKKRPIEQSLMLTEIRNRLAGGP